MTTDGTLTNDYVIDNGYLFRAPQRDLPRKSEKTEDTYLFSKILYQMSSRKDINLYIFLEEYQQLQILFLVNVDFLGL